MLTLRKKWLRSFARRTVYGVAGVLLAFGAQRSFGQVPAVGAGGGAAAAGAGGAASPGVGGAAVGGNAGVNVGGGANVTAPGVGVGGTPPGVGVGVGGTPPGVGVGGTPPGVGAATPRVGAGGTTQGGVGTFSPSVNPGAAAVQQNQAAQRNAASQTPAAQKAMNNRTGANARTNAAGSAVPNSPNANTQTRQIPTPRQNVIPGQQRSAAVQNRNDLRRGATGTISAINGNTLTFNTGSGTSTLTLTPESQVLINGQAATLADLPANASVQVFTNPSNPMEIQRIVATTNTAGTTSGQIGTTTPGRTTTNPDGSPTSTNPLGFEGQGNDIAGTLNPNGSRQNQTDPRRPPAQLFSTRTAQNPSGSTTTGGTNPDGSPTSQNPLGFEGQGNDVAGTVNPDGTITTNDGVTRNPDGTTPRSNERETQADPRKPPVQPFSNGSNQGTTGSQNQSTGQRTANFRGQMNSRNSAGTNTQRGAGAKAGMTNGQMSNLGMTLQPTNKGVLVSNVASGGVAARGSLQQGDVITAINGQTVSSPRDVTSLLNGLAPNSSVQLQILRNGQTITQTVTMPKTQQPTTQQSTAPKTAEQIAEENRALESQIEAARNQQR